MIKVAIFVLIIWVFIKAPKKPSYGVIAYYTLAILGPQYIWWWAFDGLHVSFYVAIATLLGAVFRILTQEINYAYLKTPLNFWVLMLWISLNVSYFFGPYVHLFDFPSLSPAQIYDITNNIFLFYFCAIIVANDLRSLKHLSGVLACVTIYMTYWANSQYFTQNWSQFSWGRLRGPSNIYGSSLYADENLFALLFTTGIPFIYLVSNFTKNIFLKYLILSSLIFAVHAIFLTGSRGALLALSTTIFAVLIKRKKIVSAVVILISFFIFFSLQGGDAMKSRSQTIATYKSDGSAMGRIEAWKGGWNMLKAHPITGVGLGSFVTALPNYYPTNPRVAHNTLIQYSGESGVLAGMSFVAIIGIFYSNSLKISSHSKRLVNKPDAAIIDQLNNANTAAFTGLVICSIFLSLTLYEIFFVLLLFNNSLYVYCNKSRFSL